MAGFTTAANEHLIRSNLWSRQIKEVLEDELFAMSFVRMITDFPDGDTLNIPSIGQAEVADYDEGEAVKYTAMDTGNFTFTIDQYKQSGTYITEKMKQDSYYMQDLVSSFVPKQARAIMKSIEVRIFDRMNAGQTASDLNVINGADHRFVASGVNEVLMPVDFAKARYGLQKANVPMVGLTAVLDPSVEYNLSTLTNLVNVSNNKQWEGIVRDGMSTGMKFLFNIYGFDCYVSQNLPDANETIDSVTTAAGKANFFFSAAPDIVNTVGLIRQPPKVDSEYNKDMQREEYVTTCRYGFKLFRPENLVTVLSDTDQV
jgi:hypothetical protein